ncbi:MAG: HD-GYP domain-containing protein [Pseudohongiellaceae bacterium]
MHNTKSLKPTNTIISVQCADLLIGMFVCELDRPWSGTPFIPAGFHIRRADELQMLTKFCNSVQIDISRGVQPTKLKGNRLTILSSARKASPISAAIKVNRSRYPVTSTVKKQLDSTDKSYQQLLQGFDLFTKTVRAKQPADLDSLESPIDCLVTSALCNPNTLVWCLNTDPVPVNPSAYCVRAAIWAVLLARQIGLAKAEIRALFLGTLLADIGLWLLPEHLVSKRQNFSKADFVQYQTHVELSLQFLGQYQKLDQRVIRIVRGHHERNDGRGFPNRLKGEQIPALARFANLCYCFERLLRSLADKHNASPAKAISRLYRQRDLKFPEQLVVEFIHLMGMYPIGTLIQLNTGEIAIVLEQHEAEKLSPRIAVLTNGQQEKLLSPKIIQLGTTTEKRSVLSSIGPIHSAVKASDYRFSFVGKRIGLGNYTIRF